MNAALLLEHYARIADAPDAIARMRRFVLDLAVRGKLVEQDASEEPASKLLQAFESERAIRVARKEMRKRKGLELGSEIPFEVPSSWLWLPLGETGHIFSGSSINEVTRERFSRAEDGRPFIATKDVGYGFDQLAYSNGLLVPTSEERFKTARPNTPLICAEGGSAGRKIGLCDREICFGNKLIANELWGQIAPRYVLCVYLSGFFYDQFCSRMTGVIGGISLNRFLQLPFPLPPHNEQHRIVTKVDELMALCDQLEAARAAREAARDTFTLSTLARLNTPDPEMFVADARFTLANLAPLTTRADQIKQLRQTILNLAVLGKLAEQDPADEIADVPPLRQFSAASSIDPAVFEKFSKTISLPGGWQVAPLAQLSAYIVDCPHTTPKWKEQGEICIRTNQLRPGALDLSAPRYVSPEEYVERIERLEPLVDDILYSREGGILGIACLIPPGIRLCLGQRLMLIRAGAETRPDFLELVLNSPFITSIAKACTTGGAAPRVNMSTVRAYPIPLPPLAEQHRIVVKVYELMAVCDELEAGITTGEHTRSRLLEAILRQSLKTDTDRDEGPSNA
ncbi:restriction endonuclease subunit S [Blastomonas sp.]|uniref:restriction endonuclease subunit S n=1 Tax=Blastomonas sp. TaxID=1909299 RepID=UPI0026200C9F|nr:restriction endonuclease subunit S [Blastomonas sp.]MDM7956002.1 restriction endonuclease subunit S [Blastomonas sp.]